MNVAYMLPVLVLLKKDLELSWPERLPRQCTLLSRLLACMRPAVFSSALNGITLEQVAFRIVWHAQRKL